MTNYAEAEALKTTFSAGWMAARMTDATVDDAWTAFLDSIPEPAMQSASPRPTGDMVEVGWSAWITANNNGIDEHSCFVAGLTAALATLQPADPVVVLLVDELAEAAVALEWADPSSDDLRQARFDGARANLLATLRASDPSREMVEAAEGAVVALDESANIFTGRDLKGMAGIIRAAADKLRAALAQGQSR